jgi:O-antigen ligase
MALLWASRTIAACVVAAVLINVFEMFNPFVINDSIGRSAGLYLNPNQAALALVVGMVLSLHVIGAQYRGLFILLVIVGMVTTISRSGLLALCLAIGLSLFWKAVKVKQIAMAAILGVVLVVGLLLPRLDAMIAYMERVGLSHFVEERVGWFMDPTLDESPYEANTHSRLDAAAEAWDRFSQYPFWGYGVGTHLAMAGGNEDKFATVGAHNMYLAYMVDHGILGAFVYPASVLMAVWTARGNAKRLGTSFALIMLILGFFSHTILTDTFALPLLALMAAMAALSRESEETQPKMMPSPTDELFSFQRPNDGMMPVSSPFRTT